MPRAMGYGRSRGDAWGLTAILAAAALLVQVMMPSVAAAMIARDRAVAVQICSDHGPATIAGHRLPAKGFGGMKCAACVAASLAGSAPVAAPVPVRVAQAATIPGPLDLHGALGPRSPPRVREQSPRAPPLSRL
jgi:hypothetical protein